MNQNTDLISQSIARNLKIAQDTLVQKQNFLKQLQENSVQLQTAYREAEFEAVKLQGQVEALTLILPEQKIVEGDVLPPV